MKAFVFQWVWMLWLLPVLLPLGWLLRRARGKREALRERLGGGKVAFERVRDGMRLVAVLLLILALARPGYAPERRSLSQSGRDVVFAIDVSRSMLAEDAHPSRLEAAKQGVRDALAGFGTERAGLVIYAGSATILCPLSHDHDFVRYMLDQVTPRGVDFGGTTLLPAVEKSVDKVFTAEREGMQDLVVLTDGEDHLPDAQRVAEMLDERGVDLLLVGLGDPSAESRIPIEDEEGVRRYLQRDGESVRTRLNEEVLSEMAEACEGGKFVAPGTAGFDLGEIYRDYTMGKPSEAPVGEDSFVVYREGAFVLMAAALVLLVGAGRVGVMAMILVMLTPVRATEIVEFDRARLFQGEGKLEEALEQYALSVDAVASPAQAAVVRFNQGLCYLGLAESVAVEAPSGALGFARQAQRCFLDAKRLDSGLDRAGMRLDPTAVLIAAYRKKVEEKQREEEVIQQGLEAILERLKALREEQMGLMQAFRQSLPPRPGRRGGGKAAAAPVDREASSRDFSGEQGALESEGKEILTAMESLEELMQAGLVAPEGRPVESMMEEPIRLMGEAVGEQGRAGNLLAGSTGAEAAIEPQRLAVERIDEVIALLEGGSSEVSDEGDWGDEWEDGEWDESEGEGMPSSMAMEGDLAAGSEMQPLPKPNYSAEELLMEEQGNLQFREQQRAKAQEGKVEKDW